MRDKTPDPDWASHADWIRSLLQGMTRDPELAEDLAQDAMAAGLAFPAEVRNPRGWLRVVAGRLLASHRRDQARRERRERRAVPPHPVTTPDEIAERLDRQQQVARVVRALPEPYRSVLVLRYYEAMSARRISESLGLPLATVQTRITRAHRMVRDALGREHGSAWAGAFLPLAGVPLPPGAGGPSAAAASSRALPSARGVAATLLAAFLVGVAGWLLFAGPEEARADRSATVAEADGVPPATLGVEDVAPEEAPAITREDEPASAPATPDPPPPGPAVGAIHGRVVVPDASELGPRARSRWAVRVREIDPVSERVGGVWTTEQSTATLGDDRLEPLGFSGPFQVPSQAQGKVHRLEADGSFTISRLPVGRYDFLLERDGLPVVLLYDIEATTDGSGDPRLQPLVVLERVRRMELLVQSTDGRPVRAHPIYRYPDGKILAQTIPAGPDGRLELYCPRDDTPPDVVLLASSVQPVRLAWQDGEQEVTMEAGFIVYLRATVPATVDESVQMPYLIFRPAAPILGLPPGYFSTKVDLKPLAEGKTLRLHAHAAVPHALDQQTRAHGHGFPLQPRHYAFPIASGIQVDPASPLRATEVALPRSFRHPPGAEGAQYTLLPDRVVDLEELRSEQ